MILYFSGTGNSNYVAKRIADALGDALVNLNDRIKASDTSSIETGERVIIVTPTYAWRIPRVVRDWLLKTELYVHEDKDTRQIDGFIGLMGNHIEGIFVAKAARSKGVGKALLEYAKSRKPRLTLSVYQKNELALAFYRREQFVVQTEGIDEDTNEAYSFYLQK